MDEWGGCSASFTQCPRTDLSKRFLPKPIGHRGRNQRYSFQIDLDHGSSTLQFLQFWNQNVVNILFLVLESLEVISGFISKLMKKISRWRHH